MRRMPWTGASFAVGSASIAGLPPLKQYNDNGEIQGDGRKSKKEKLIITSHN